MKRTRPVTTLVGRFALSVVVLAALTPAAGAQSASEIVDRMLDEYARRAEGVEDYTLVQEVMGFETVSYYEKEMVDGRPVFRLHSGSAAGVDMPDAGQAGGLDDIFAVGGELADRAEYEGVERVDDYDLHVLRIDDFSGLDFGRNVTPDSEFTPRSGVLYLDVDTYAPRRLVFQGDMRNAQGTHTVTTTVGIGDYREVEGMLIAYSTSVRIDGLAQAIDPETREQFEQMQRELEALPPEQRAMVESMMSGQLEQFRAMMSGEDAPMTVQILVREVRVNQGPPG
jgi:hypothetical protein